MTEFSYINDDSQMNMKIQKCDAILLLLGIINRNIIILRNYNQFVLKEKRKNTIDCRRLNNMWLSISE